MASLEHASLIAQSRAFSNPQEQVVALRRLKNQIIGHTGKKEILVQQGLIDALAEILRLSSQSLSKHSAQSTNGSSQYSPSTAPSFVSEEIHYQCLTLLNSLARAGNSLLTPLIHASLEDYLVASASLDGNSPRIVTAALKTIESLVQASHNSSIACETADTPWREKWNRPVVARTYRAVLSQTTHSMQVKSQVSLVCQILCKTVASDQHQELLCSTGVLDSIAAHLASHYVHNHPRSAKAFSTIACTLPAPPSLKLLPDILGAVNTLVEDSKYRVAKLLLSPSLAPLFPFYSSQAALEARIHQSSVYGTWDINPSEMALPCIHNGIQKPDSSFSKAFPALGSTQADKNPALIDFAESDKSQAAASVGVDSLFTPWLMHLMRTSLPLTRIRAARLLATIARAGFITRPKSYSVALLVIPLLLDLLKSSMLSTNLQNSDPLQDSQSHALQEVPIALAHFLEEAPSISSAVLKAAAEGAVVRETCQYLKKTFEPIDVNAPLWSENVEDVSMNQDSAPTRSLGKRGLSPKMVHVFNCRKAGLILLSCIASREDKYRKPLLDHGAMQYIVDSLAPLNASAVTSLQSQGIKQKLDGTIGNPNGVIIAACRATTAMSRSVLMLRTSLMDAAIAKPILDLVQHHETDVKVAALAVMCNFLIDSSPMRNGIVGSGAIPILASHARMSDSRIRAGALWALKHLVSQANPNVKRDCIEELDINWLMHVIEGNGIPASSNSSTSKVSPHLSINAASNAMGERVSIFHTPDDDEHMHDESAHASPTFKAEDGTVLGDVEKSKGRDADPLGKPIDPQHQAYLSSVKSSEEAEKAQQPSREANQIQGHALDIVRNVLCGPGEHAMIDYVLNSIGHARFYGMLASKMQAPTSRNINEIPHKTLDAALKTLCHVAAGAPHYRSQLINQPNLLQLLLPLFYHQDPEIRCTCCWILINLMWVDDSTDVTSAKDRSNTLKRMGFDAPLEALSRRLGDGGHEQSQDVRERAAAARDSMMQTTEGRPARSSESGGLGSMVGSLRPS